MEQAPILNEQTVPKEGKPAAVAQVYKLAPIGEELANAYRDTEKSVMDILSQFFPGTTP